MPSSAHKIVVFAADSAVQPLSVLRAKKLPGHRAVYSSVQIAKPFSLLSKVYDAIMDDIDYDAWGGFIIDTVRAMGWNEGAILDIGCGTGNSTFPMFTRGFEVTGLDASADMLSVAREKLPPVTFVEADFMTFKLDRRFSLIYSVFDSLNNLLDPRDFEEMARTVYRHLEPGGFFVFDVNTTVGLRDLWEAGIAEGWAGEVYYRWDHSFDEATGLAKVEAYCEDEQQSFTEIHFERAYDEPELRTLLEAAGFCRFTALSYPGGGAVDGSEPRLWIVVQKLPHPNPST